MAVYYFGERDGGRVEECDGTYVETRYFHLQYFPLKTCGSILRLGDETYRIPTHRPSAHAGFGRFYFLVLSVTAFGVGFTQNGGALFGLATVGAIFFALWIRAMRAGKLSPDAIACRRVYRAVTGFSADPALVVHVNPTLAPHLHVELTTRAERLAPDGYRDALTEWSSVATTGGEVDVSFLAIALTLARIEGRSDVHAAVWSRLAPLAAQLPETVAPLTALHGDRSEATAPSAQPFVPQAYTLDAVRGSFIESGFDVTVPRRSYDAPPLCASCLEPAHLVRASFKSSHRVGVPYCTSCTLHGDRQNSGNAMAKLLVLAGTGAAGLLAFISGPPLPVSIALVAVVAAGAALGLAYALPVRRAAAPATMTFDAARLVAHDDETVTLFCKNAEWSQRLAEHFQGNRREARHVHPRALTFPMLGLIAALGAGGLGWHLNNPKMRVDNGLGTPVAVWVDGRVVAEAPPTTNESTTDLRLPRGSHVIGWSKVGASLPEQTVSATVAAFEGDYLFDPAAHHCYWVDAMVYGNATLHDPLMGARPVGLFHDFSIVHDWFVNSPSTNNKGTVRYSLSRGNCDELRKCPAGVRETYWTCLVGATDVGVARCKADARKACGWDEAE